MSLVLREVTAGYGTAQVLFGMTLAVGAGEVVALMGRNGMGKTTTVRTVMGLVKASGGEISFRETRLDGAAPHVIARQGIGLVPEGRQVFPTLTVEENLIATAAARHGAPRWTLERIYRLFPRLQERRRSRGSNLSGGEQQMLAIGRALMTNPSLLILDEATEGLAPLIRLEIFQCLSALRAEGESILLIDKHLSAMKGLVDRIAIVEKGRVAWGGTVEELAGDPTVVARYLQA